VADAPFTIGPGTVAISKPLLLWVNDGLMAIFFFVVGLRDQARDFGGRTCIISQCSGRRRCRLRQPQGVWWFRPCCITAVTQAVPARAVGEFPWLRISRFALGILAMLGKRVPLALTVFPDWHWRSWTT
jgi:NhaA family Na+:H+ antiporter